MIDDRMNPRGLGSGHAIIIQFQVARESYLKWLNVGVVVLLWPNRRGFMQWVVVRRFNRGMGFIDVFATGFGAFPRCPLVLKYELLLKVLKSKHGDDYDLFILIPIN